MTTVRATYLVGFTYTDDAIVKFEHNMEKALSIEAQFQVTLLVL